MSALRPLSGVIRTLSGHRRMTEFAPTSAALVHDQQVLESLRCPLTIRRQFDILAKQAADLPVEQPAKFELINMTNRWRFAYSNALPAGGWSVSDAWMIDA